MECFVEGTYSESSNDMQGKDIVAKLYSMIHHSDKLYNSNIINLPESYEARRTKANRWDALENIEASANTVNCVPQTKKTPFSMALDHIPINDHNIPSTSTAVHDKQYNRRDQNVNYAWKRNRNRKPWSINDRIRNDNKLNRNLVPIRIEKSPISPQISVDPQDLLKISYYESFDSCNLQNDVHTNAKFSRGHGKPVKYNRDITESFENNCGNLPYNKNRMMIDMSGEGSESADLNILHETDTNVKQSEIASCNTTECFAGSVEEESVGLLEKNCKMQSTLNAVNGNIKCSLSSENVSEDIIIVTDSDESYSDNSIVEVSVPPKPEPPLISLDSSDETELVNVSNIEPVLNVTLESDKPPNLHENSNCMQISKRNVESTNESLLSVSAKSKKIKKKKKDKHVKSIECETWTSGMVHFYNKSWGGETYDHVKIQREMTNNPTNWKILDIDKYGPVRDFGPLARVRCINCHQMGHLAKYCPDPRKIICCSLCGKQGHGGNQCPNILCLKCGRPARVYNEGCPACWKTEHPKNCTTCGANDHFQWLCPEMWRKFHSTTSVEELQLGTWTEPQFKSPGELACCICTERGHTASKCPVLTMQHVPLSNPQQIDIFATLNFLNKKRKKKWRSSLNQGHNEYEFNRKRRKTR